MQRHRQPADRYRNTGGQTARELLDSYRGGLALERLYRSGLMRYRLVIAEKLG